MTIALLHPGEMGAAVGACLSRHRVLWVSAGRSPSTHSRARAAKLEDAQTLERALEAADIVFSVCPPHAATEVAREVARRKFKGLYVDCNAIAPDTAREAARIVQCPFVDAGIVGPPPTQSGRSRIYLSGSRAGEIAALFAGTNMEAIALDAPVGAASAVKACYAAWTKGATALLAAIRTLAKHENVESTLIEEWRRSQPELPQRSEAVTAQARKAWRWIGEMEEIAASFRAAGLPEGFHLAAAEIYRSLEQYKDPGSPPSLDEVIATLSRYER
jgi:3-hydroxyisobutyrate dehydrogenase-like beta-hydroxyacid dehydrogenase